MISIHAPSRERRINRLDSISTIRFQSTLPRGSDGLLLQSPDSCTVISIHAPSRERLGGQHSKAYRSMISIHAPSRERHHTGYTIHRHRTFQSTLPRGSDFTHLSYTRRDGTFQSTLPRGSDKILAFLTMVCPDFNPRSLAGATSSFI